MNNINITIVVVTVFSIMAIGCSSAPDYEVPQISIDETYMYGPVGESATTHSKKDWWTRFDDPVLNQLVWDTQHRNITLRTASERIQMAKNYRQIVESFKLPTVSLSASYYHYQISENTPLIGGLVSPIGLPSGLQPTFGESITLADAQQDGLILGATVAWEVDLFSRIEHQVNSAKIREEQAKIYKQGLYTLITAEVINNYLQLRGTQERKQVLVAMIADQKNS
ncbi:MAG: TolC family protein [Vibrio sp.]